MRLRDDFSLELSELKPDDQGTYTCEIDVMGKPLSIKHKVKRINFGHEIRVQVQESTREKLLLASLKKCIRNNYFLHSNF